MTLSVSDFPAETVSRIPKISSIVNILFAAAPVIYRSYMAFDPHTRTGSDTVERERYSVVPFFESGP